MARKQYCSVDISTNVLRFKFANGKTLEFDPADLPQEQKDNALKHGIKQKLSDAFAGAKDVSDPVAFAIEAVQANWDSLMQNQWNPGRVGSQMFDLAEALRRLAEEMDEDLSLETAQEIVKGWDAKTRAEKRKIPAIKRILAQMEIEKTEGAEGPSLKDVLK